MIAPDDLSRLAEWLRDYDCGDDIAHAQFDAAADALSSQSLSLSEARAENDRKDVEIERLKGLVAGIRECPQEPSRVEVKELAHWALDRMSRPLDDTILPSTGATASGDARCMQIIRDYIASLEGCHKIARQEGLLEGVRVAAEVANGVEPSLLKGMSERYVSIYCAARRDASDLIKSIPSADCEYCSNGKLTGLPGNSCENCLNTGLQYPEFSR